VTLVNWGGVFLENAAKLLIGPMAVAREWVIPEHVAIFPFAVAISLQRGGGEYTLLLARLRPLPIGLSQRCLGHYVTVLRGRETGF